MSYNRRLPVRHSNKQLNLLEQQFVYDTGPGVPASSENHWGRRIRRALPLPLRGGPPPNEFSVLPSYFIHMIQSVRVHVYTVPQPPSERPPLTERKAKEHVM